MRALNTAALMYCCCPDSTGLRILVGPEVTCTTAGMFGIPDKDSTADDDGESLQHSAYCLSANLDFF